MAICLFFFRTDVDSITSSASDGSGSVSDCCESILSCLCSAVVCSTSCLSRSMLVILCFVDLIVCLAADVGNT